jgi:catechol 2,3-dioxygenase-like lactoylglutathione lyase family enzyme
MIRLRQIALVAHDLAKASADIRAVLGLDYAYDDPGVGKYGLHNAVFPIGNTFLEVVSPTTESTTAGRLLDKRGGDGGYMVILQVSDLQAARQQALEAGVRFADLTDGDGFAFTHLHAMQPWDRWQWGGPGWEDHIRTDTSLGIVGAEVQAHDPAKMAARWGEVLGLPVVANGGAPRIALDGGEIRFVPVEDGRGEGLGGFDVAVRDLEAVRAAATQRGLIGPDGSIVLAGTRVRLLARNLAESPGTYAVGD